MKMKTKFKKLVALVLVLAILLPLAPKIEKTLVMQVGAAEAYTSTIDMNRFKIGPVYNDSIYNELKANWIKYGTVTTSSATMSIGPLFFADVHPATQMAWGYNHGGIFNMITGTKVVYDDVGMWTYNGGKYAGVFSDETVMRIGANSYSGGSMKVLDSDNNVLGTATKGYIDVNYSRVKYLETRKTLTTPYAVAIDNQKPGVSGFWMNDFSSLSLTFDEYIRPARGNVSLDEYTVTISYGNTKSGLEIGRLTYKAGYLDNKTMIFYHSSGDIPSAGDYKILSITGSSNGKEDEIFDVFGIGEAYAYSVGYDSLNHKEKLVYLNNPLQFIATVNNKAPVTDLAGNAVNLPSQMDLTGYNIVIDTKAPTIEKVTVTDNMSPKLNEIEKNNWPKDIDLSAVYAGVGEKLYFDVQFSEVMERVGSVTLNVSKNGQAVTLSSPTLKTSTNANGDTCTVARYGPLTVTADMSMSANHENSYIQITSIDGQNCDKAGNDLAGNVGNAAQKIYLDAKAPTVTASLYSGNGTRNISIKIGMNDDGSGFLGLNGKIGISAVVEKAVSYKMAITDNISIPNDSAYQYSGILQNGSVSWQDIPLYSGTRYIHIKLLGDAGTITVDDLKVEYQIPDWAGNKNTTQSSSVEPNYAYDEKPPKIDAPSVSVTYTSTNASISAEWSASDYNGDDGITTYYQWSNTTPADYSTGWVSAGEQTSGFKWILPESGKPIIPEDKNSTHTLWVYAADKSGNKSQMVSKRVDILLDKPNYSLSLVSDPVIPTNDPELKAQVSGSSDGDTGYMRVFVSFAFPEFATGSPSGDYAYTYVFLLKSSELTSAQDIFPLSGLGDRTVYRVTMGANDTFTNVSQRTVSQFEDILKKWYGDIKVEVDLAYDDLVPNVGNTLSSSVTNGSYYKPDDEITFRYSSPTDGLYSAAFTDFTDAEGESFTGDKLFYQTLGGVSFDVTITNNVWSDWGVIDVDFNNTYVSIVPVNDDGSFGDPLITIPLAAQATNRVTIPNIVFETGAYAAAITVTQQNGVPETQYDSTVMVVDNSVATSVGVTDTYITPNISVNFNGTDPLFTQFDENGRPFMRVSPSSSLELQFITPYVLRKTAENGYLDSMTVSMVGQNEAVRSDTFTAEVGGILDFGFTINGVSVEQKIGGFTVGKVKAMYVWNPAIHDSRESGLITTDGLTYSYASERATNHTTWVYDEITGIGTGTLNRNEAGIYTMAEQIGLTDGDNTICIQIVMENGLESAIVQFKIYANNSAPSASLGMDVLEEVDAPAAEGDPINIVRADVNLQNLFSNSNIVGIYYLAKYEMGQVSYNEDGKEIYTVSERDYWGDVDAVMDGYYEDALSLKKNAVYGIISGGYVYDRDNNIIKNFDYYVRDPRNYYTMFPMEGEEIIRLYGGKYSYKTVVNSGVHDCVTSKSVNNYYSAVGGFLIVDESGASTILFPQFADADSAYDTNVVAGYKPKYKLTDHAVTFGGDFEVTETQYNISNGTLEMNAKVNNAQYVDSSISYVRFTDEDGNEIERCYLDGYLADPNKVGYYVGSIDDKSVNIDLVNPLADGVNHQVGERVESVWAQLFLYDKKTDRVITSNIVEVTHSGRVYVDPVPRAYWTDSYDGLRVHWNTPVYAEGSNDYANMNHKLNIFEDGDHQITVTDQFGVTQTVTLTTTHFAQFQTPHVEIDNTSKTTRPVTVTITVPDGAIYDSVSVSSSDENVIIEGSGTDKVTVTFKASATATVSWDIAPDDPYSGNMGYGLNISNIVPVDLAVRWDYGETPEDYLFGDAIAYVYDKNGWDIIDPMTGKAPMYTFVYGSGVTEYTFPTLSNGEMLDENVYNDLGAFTVTLEVDLTEPPPPPVVEIDTRAPSVQIIPYAMRNQTAVSREMYLIYEDREERVQSGDEIVVDMLNPALIHDNSYTAYTDAAEFTKALGWASRFRFNIEVQDLSKTRIVIKEGIYADTPTSYYSATSDSVANVTLQGNTLEVTGPAQFTIFAIDEKGNVTAFRMDLYNVGTAPVPTYTKVPVTNGDDRAILIDFTVPADGTDLEITAIDGKAATEALFTQNGTYTISYTYVYKGEPVDGQITVEVIEVDNDMPVLLSRKWSVQAGTVTRGEVIATLTFNKPVDLVQAALSAAELPDCVEVRAVGNTVTVKYSENYDKLELRFRGLNGKWSDAITLEAVTCIDRDLPTITVGNPVYSSDGKKATVNFTANETVSFREGSGVGTSFTRTLKENGVYEYTFVDRAGNSATVSVNITGIVNTYPTIRFSKHSDGSESVANPDELGDVMIGDIFYVSVNRASTVSFNGESYTVEAGQWLELTVGDKSGGSIYAKDAYGNVTGAVFTSIDYPDLTAPQMALTQYTVYASLLDLSDLDAKIRANCEAVDDRDGNVSVDVEYEMPTVAGVYTVTYTAKDSAGNLSVMTGALKVYETTAPGLMIDGNFLERESIYVADRDDELKLTVDTQSEPYELSYRPGILTAAQMKIYATELEVVDGEIILPFAGVSGYYTILVTTQSHDQYRVTIYIK